MPSSLRVLLLEDHPNDAELIEHELRRNGFDPICKRVDTREDFLAALDPGLDIILADFSLPQFDGLQALRLLRERGANIPVIIVTGSISEEAAVECMREGATDYLIKDRLARLGSAVSRALEQKHMQQEKMEADQRLRLLSAALESAANATVISDRNHTIVWVNKAFTHLTGYTFEEVAGYNLDVLSSGLHDSGFYAQLYGTLAAGRAYRGEITNRRKDGSIYVEEISITPVRDDHDEITHFVEIKQEITQRKRREREREATSSLSNALREARTLKEMLSIVVDQVMKLFDARGAALVIRDPGSEGMHEQLAQGVLEKVDFLNRLDGQGLTIRGFMGNPGDAPGSPELADSAPAYIAVGVPLDAQDETIGVLWVANDNALQNNDVQILGTIANLAANAIYRSRLFEETERRLQRLTALREIEKAITGSLDVRVTLSILVEEVTAQLSMDAADVFLINPSTKSLEFAASYGFRRDYSRSTRLPGQGYAYRAMLERRIISIPNIAAESSEFTQSIVSHGENFNAYFAIPLFAKGQVKGVLEVYNREIYSPNPEWLDFLETLAGQAALAIDNAELFEDLQHSNVNLSLAYDATIEGWSSALDLRDQETEGHTQRVTRMTERLARAYGIDGEELRYIRWGSLLHDIGKMGIPDEILLKPGPLTPEEQEVIRRHPQYAYDLLVPITFLRPALDIPYCHHERWDGTGYPRGLKGKEIPLAARLFSIVDVYDALIEKRVYRPEGMQVEKVLAYIREQSGQLFDPEIVELFLAETSKGWN